ncbi:hypothetical protein AUJ14_01615 [Candidatus Micrarchaeota archaeon CG1_02_55_22]|nr:MAG: hypothetical protein AUJ14_01615 [Candidatus Micrarchaeota archaeon CG1_02_55_22]
MAKALWVPRVNGEETSWTGYIEERATDRHAVSRVNHVEPAHWSAIERVASERDQQVILPVLSGKVKNLNQLAVEAEIPRTAVSSRLSTALHNVARSLKRLDHLTHANITRFVAELADTQHTLSPEEIHSLVGLELERGAPPLHAYWMEHRPLSALYSAVRSRNANGEFIASRKGKGFFGHGSWYNYVRNQFGIVVPRMITYQGRRYVRNFEKSELIPAINKLVEDVPPNSHEWTSNPALKSYYQAVSVRDSSGNWIPLKARKRVKGFLGHGSWEKFIELELGRAMTPRGRRSKFGTNEELKARIRAELQWAPAHSAYWLAHPELKKLHRAAFLRDANGRQLRSGDRTENTFFGHKDWYTFLEKELGVVPLRSVEFEGREYRRDYQVNEAMYAIAAKITLGTPDASTEWRRDPELKKLYAVARTTGKNGKHINQSIKSTERFFGHGSWRAMIKVIKRGEIEP